MSSDSRFFESRALALGIAVVAHMIELGTPTLEAAARYVSDPFWKSEGQMCEALLQVRDSLRPGNGRFEICPNERQAAFAIYRLA